MAYFSIPRSGLVGEWLLDGSPNDTNDGTKSNATPTNIVYNPSKAGYVKQAATFNSGGTSSVDTITLPALSGAYSLVGTFTPSAAAINGTYRIMFRWSTGNSNEEPFYMYYGGYLANGYRIDVQNTGNSHFASNFSKTFVAGKTYLVFVTVGAGSVNVYFDNALDNTLAYTGTAYTRTTGFAIGNRVYNRNEGWYGDIGGVRLYDHVLSEQERLQLWHEFNRKLGGGSDFGAYVPAPTSAFDFINGDLNDYAGQTVAATVSGTSSTTDQFGITKGLLLNGSATVNISTSCGTSGTSDFYYSGWFYLKQPQSGYYPMCVSSFSTSSPFSGPTIFFDPLNVNGLGNKVIFRVINSNQQVSSISASSLYDGYHKLSFTRVAGVCKGFVDGVEVVSFTDNTSIASPNAFYLTGQPSTQLHANGSKILSAFFNKERGVTPQQEAFIYATELSRYPYAFRRSIPSALSNGLLFRGGAFNGSTMYDESGNGNNFTGTATKVRSGQLDAGSFSSQLLTLTRSAALENANGSVACWFKTSSRANAGVIIENNNVINSDRYGILIYRDPSGFVNFEVANASAYYRATTAVAFDDGKWHRAVGTWDGSTIKLYIDGALMASAAQGSAIAYNAQDFKIGGDTTNATRYFAGSLAYPTLWNRVLNSYEVMMDRYSIYTQ